MLVKQSSTIPQITMFIQDGAPKIAKLPYFSGFMVDITIVNGGYFMVYKPTNITGGPHPVGIFNHSQVPVMGGSERSTSASKSILDGQPGGTTRLARPRAALA